MAHDNVKKVCILAAVFWPIYPGFGGRHGYVLAENLVEAGYDVDVVAAFPVDLRRKWNFFKQKPVSRENLNGIRVHRVFTFLPTGLGLLRKALFYLSFIFASLLAIPAIRRADYVLGLHPPPAFLVFPGFVFSRLLRGKYIIRITDLWPDVVFEFELANSAPMKQFVILLAKTMYGLANHIMAFTPEIRDRMLESGIPENKISTVEMAVDTDLFHPMSLEPGEAKKLGVPEPKDKFVVFYAGAFALTYDFDALLEVARRLREENILFVILGDGDAKNQIIDTIKKHDLKNVVMPSPVSRPELVAKHISYSDVCVMPLKSEMVTSTLTRPSKVFEFWACGKPVISCTKGEIEYLTQESGAGMIVEPGDVDGLTAAIRHLYENPQVTSDMGNKAREYVEGRYSYESLRTSLIDALNRCN